MGGEGSRVAKSYKIEYRNLVLQVKASAPAAWMERIPHRVAMLGAEFDPPGVSIFASLVADCSARIGFVETGSKLEPS